MHRKLPSGAVWAEPRVPAQCPAADSRRVKSAAARLRRQVSWWIGDSPALTDHLQWMARNGFEREDMRQIRYTVEIFYNCEPIFAIAHALGSRVGADSPRSPACSDPSAGLFPDAVTAGLIPLPPVSTTTAPAHAFFRALSAWPGYGEMVTHEMLSWHALPELVTCTVTEARYLASRILVEGVSDRGRGRDSDRLLPSCEVLVVASALRQVFINGEVKARDLRETEEAFGWSV